MGLTRPKYNNIDTAKFEIDDPITEINTGLNSGNPNPTDIGFIFKRGSSGNNSAMLWDKSEGEFAFVLTTATGDSTGDLTFTNYTNLRVDQFKSGGMTYPVADGTNGQILTTDGNGILTFQDPTIPVQTPTAWGTITGTLSNQTDLQTALDNIHGGSY